MQVTSLQLPMKKTFALLVAVSTLVISVQATTYLGNTKNGFGGAIGGGSLTLSDNGTTISGSFTKGSGGFDNALVIYIDSVAGGFSDTSGFADAQDGLRKAISGFDGGGNRSTLTLPTGFLADYAIALGPANENFGGLWQLANGGNNSLNFQASVNLSPTGTSSAASYSFSFDFSQIGLTGIAGDSFKLFGTYISNSGFRSDEAIAGDDTGTQGWNPFTATSSAVYVVPEPSTLSLLGLAGLGGWFWARRRGGK